MDERLRQKCELLSENRNAIRKQFGWENNLMCIVAALVFTNVGQKADVPKMEECKKILKKNAGVFSDLRGYMYLIMLSKMTLAGDPEGFLKHVQEIHRKLHEKRVFGSEYMALAAVSICENCDQDQVDSVVEKTRTLMKRMRAEHPLLTGDSDMTFAALLAMTDKSIDKIIEDTEEGYEFFKKKFAFHKNAVQALSHIIALNEGSIKAGCEKVAELFDEMRSRKVKYGKETELAALGMFVNTEVPKDELVTQIDEAEKYLKNCKGFGSFSIERRVRLMFSALLAAQVYGEVSEGTNDAQVRTAALKANAIGGSVSIAIAEELMLLVCIIASSSASANTN